MILFDFFNDTSDELLEKFAHYFSINVNELRYFFITTNYDEITATLLVKTFNLDLKQFDSKSLSIMCRHMTTGNELTLNSFKNLGILNLKEMLQQHTPLSDFLSKRGISVDVENSIIKVNDIEYPIMRNNEICNYCYIGREDICLGYTKCKLFEKISKLAVKLYVYDATVEFFINASISQMKAYSTIDRYPEILETLENIRIKAKTTLEPEQHLGWEWSDDKKECFLLEFPVCISNMETFAPMCFDEGYREVKDCLEFSGYTYSDYNNLNISQNFFDNYYFINKFISIYFYNSEEYGSLLPDMSVSPKGIKYYRVTKDDVLINID